MNNIVMEQTRIATEQPAAETSQTVDLTGWEHPESAAQNEQSQFDFVQTNERELETTDAGSIESEIISVKNDIDITQLKDKDAKAWEELYREISPWLTRYAQNLCYKAGCLDEAEDLAQEAVLRLIKYIDNYDTQQKSEKWKFHLLTTIINNLILDKTKSSRYKRDTPSDAIPDSFDNSADTESIVINAMEVDRVMAMLPEDQKKLLIERYYYEFTAEELAQRTGLKAGLIRSRTTRINSFVREKEIARSSVMQELK